MPIVTPDMSAPWVKVGTKIRCKEALEFPNPFFRRPFTIRAGREAAIVGIGPGEVDCEGFPVMIDDVAEGNIVIGWFDYGTGQRNGFYTQMRGDFMFYWEPLSVAQARERPNRPMILDQHPSVNPKTYVGSKVWEEGSDRHPPMKNRYEPGRRFIGFWASCADPDADHYAQKGKLLPWPGDFIDESWDADERAMVIKYLKEAEEVEQWRGGSSCRLCQEYNGSKDLGDAHFTWAEGFAHYVEEHGVRPAAEFINHVWRANGVMKGCFGT